MLARGIVRPVLRSLAVRTYAGGHAASSAAKKETAEMPDIVTGLELQEREAAAEGREVFGERELTGPFGTPEKPVIVHSIFDRRIVGCEGGKGREHELTWHVVSHGKPLICLECGQAFQLKKID